MSVARFLFTGKVIDFLAKKVDAIVIEDDSSDEKDDDSQPVFEIAGTKLPVLFGKKDFGHLNRQYKNFSYYKKQNILNAVSLMTITLKHLLKKSNTDGHPIDFQLGRDLTPGETARLNEAFSIGIQEKLIECKARQSYPKNDPGGLVSYNDIKEFDDDENPLNSQQMEYYAIRMFQKFPANKTGKLKNLFNVPIYYSSIRRLLPTFWLDDPSINSFFAMICERSKKNYLLKDTAARKREIRYVWNFNTFFYPKLKKEGFDSVKRWTKSVHGTIFSRDMIFVPLHLTESHWALGVVNFTLGRFEYYDSLGVNKKNVAEFQFFMQKYLKNEMKRIREDNEKYPNFRTDVDLSAESWKECYIMKNCPSQDNNSDCGEFLCRFAEYLSRSAGFDFTSVDMIYFRRRHAIEIINGELF